MVATWMTHIGAGRTRAVPNSVTVLNYGVADRGMTMYQYVDSQ